MKNNIKLEQFSSLKNSLAWKIKENSQRFFRAFSGVQCGGNNRARKRSCTIRYCSFSVVGFSPQCALINGRKTLFDDFGNYSGANSPSAFADSKSETLVHSNWCE